MLLQVTVRFIIYIDQLLDKGGKDKSFEGVGAISENIVCEYFAFFNFIKCF